MHIIRIPRKNSTPLQFSASNFVFERKIIYELGRHFKAFFNTVLVTLSLPFHFFKQMSVLYRITTISDISCIAKYQTNCLTDYLEFVFLIQVGEIKSVRQGFHCLRKKKMNRCFQRPVYICTFGFTLKGSFLLKKLLSQSCLWCTSPSFCGFFFF